MVDEFYMWTCFGTLGKESNCRSNHKKKRAPKKKTNQPLELRHWAEHNTAVVFIGRFEGLEHWAFCSCSKEV